MGEIHLNYSVLWSVLILFICLTFSSKIQASQLLTNKSVQSLVLNSKMPPAKIGQKPHHLDRFIVSVFQQLNFKIKCRNTPSKRSFKETNLGIVDGSYPHIASTSDYYKNLIKVPEPLGVHDLVAITNNPHISLSNGLAELTQYKMGYIAGWLMLEPLIKGRHNLHAVANKATLFNMLKAKRFDIIFYSRVAATAFVKQEQSPSLRVLEPAIRTDRLYLFMHKKHQKLLPLITNKMKQLGNGAQLKL